MRKVKTVENKTNQEMIEHTQVEIPHIANKEIKK